MSMFDNEALLIHYSSLYRHFLEGDDLHDVVKSDVIEYKKFNIYITQLVARAVATGESPFKVKRHLTLSPSEFDELKQKDITGVDELIKLIVLATKPEYTLIQLMMVLKDGAIEESLH